MMFELPTLPRWAWYVLGAVAALLILWFALDSYGDRRFKEGKAHEAALWEAAERKLLEKAADAKTQADKAAAARSADYAASVAVERNEINAAIENGDSPMDVLFGPAR